jgi:two-component system sensor histidine kinase FlrB
LCEALLNLLQNSIQATGSAGQIRLTLQHETAQQLTLLISDNGPGIAPELLPHIFEPFFTRKAGGSGLGLAVVQAVIQSHQGQIRYLLPAERPTGQLSGACFAITLPLMAATAKGRVALKAKQLQQETSHV